MTNTLITYNVTNDYPNKCNVIGRVSYRILIWGEKQDGSGMIVVCETRVCILGGSGGMPPQENFEFRSC